MFQNVIGPVRGVFVSTFACPVGEGDRFLGYFKLYRRRPRCYCDPDYFGSGTAADCEASVDQALHRAALAARSSLRRQLEAPAASLPRTSSMFCRSA
jgi:hypothetical protein